MKDPCTICENFIHGLACDLSNCPVFAMKAENKKLKAENKSLKNEISKLQLEMSYMTSPNTIGDCHEMGAW